MYLCVCLLALLFLQVCAFLDLMYIHSFNFLFHPELTLHSLTGGRGSRVGDKGRPPSILAAEDDDERSTRPTKQTTPSAAGSTSTKKRKKKRNPVTANLSGTRYDIGQ